MPKNSKTATLEEHNEYDNFIRNFVNKLIDAVVELVEMSIENHHYHQHIKSNDSNPIMKEDNYSVPVECRNNVFLKRSASEHIVLKKNGDEQEKYDNILHHQIKDKKRKMKIFHNILNFNWTKHKTKKNININDRSSKTDEDSSTLVNEEYESYDDFPNQFTPIFQLNDSSLNRSRRKSVSVFELNTTNNKHDESTPKLRRSSSTLKRMFGIGYNNDNNNNSANISTMKFLKRSLSLRDLAKKKMTNDEIGQKKWIKKDKMEINGNGWKHQQSVQSLVETSCFHGSNDSSFINYDALNEFHYPYHEDKIHYYADDDDDYQIGKRRNGTNNDNKWIERTQSMKEKEISPHFRKYQYRRQTTVIPTTTDLTKARLGSLEFLENSSTISLPSTFSHSQNNLFSQLEENEVKTIGKYNTQSTRRHYSSCNRLNSTSFIQHRSSISSTNGHYGTDSFRSIGSGSDDSGGGGGGGVAGGGCVTNKLKRHNATRLKYNPTTFIHTDGKQKGCFITEAINNNCNKKVRSRSLNHLDSLEARQSTLAANRTTHHSTSINTKNYSTEQIQLLKDSKSEPDCTKSLLLSAPVISTSSSIVSPSLLIGEESENGSANGCSGTRMTKEFVPPIRSPLATSPVFRNYISSKIQPSSSQCFKVYYEVGDESTWESELLPAQQGITLYDAISKQCESRYIDLTLCDAKLVQDKEENSSSNNTEHLFHQDTINLVGKIIRIIEKDQSGKKYSSTSRPSIYNNHSRKSSGNYRPSRTFAGASGGGTFFSSSSTEEPSSIQTSISTLSLSPHQDSEQNKKQIKQRLTAFFGNNKDMRYEVLIEQLDKYSKHGIPHNSIYPQGQCESIDALYKLEDDWRSIIDFRDLNDRQQQQQTALWELIKTEVAYIKTLKVVTNLFLGCLKDLQTKNVFKEIDTEKLFSNITEILDANVIFWRNTLFPLVKDMRRHHRPPCLENMLEGFAKIHDVFQPYYQYCAEQSRCQRYCRENFESDVFTAYLTWCESQKDCNRLRLMDILVQPMQRLTKYGLLLKAILKNTDEDVEKESLQAMIKKMDDFVNNVNSSLKHRQDKERLKGIIARIESYDIVESKDDDIERILKKEKTFTQLDLTKPMLGCSYDRKRHLLLEGDLKLKDGSASSKIEVHCFLLTDMLLICKQLTKKSGLTSTMKVIRQPYLVDRLTVHELNHRETASLAIIYHNEFDMAVAAFILQNNDGRKIKGWKDGIMKAQQLYSQAKQMSTQFFIENNECFDISDLSLDNYSYAENDLHNFHQIAPVRSPLVSSSSRASRVSSSLAHSHSGSVEMNDQSSTGVSNKDHQLYVTRGSCTCDQMSLENNENRTGSISSDEGLQPLPLENGSCLTVSPVMDKTIGSNAQKNALKTIRFFHKSTPNTLSVQSINNLGQSLPNLTLESSKIGDNTTVTNTIGSGFHSNLANPNNTLSVPINSTSNYKTGGSHLLSPTQRGISYPPPSPTRGNLRRSHAIVSQQRSKNPPLIKTRQVQHSTSLSCGGPTITGTQHVSSTCSIDIDVPVIAARTENNDTLLHRSNSTQAATRPQRHNTAGFLDDVKKYDNEDPNIHKRLSWNSSVQAHEESLDSLKE